MKLSRRAFLQSLGFVPLLGVNLPEVKEPEPVAPEPISVKHLASEELWQDTMNWGNLSGSCSFYTGNAGSSCSRPFKIELK